MGKTVDMEVQGIRLKYTLDMLSRIVSKNLENMGRSPWMPGEGVWVLVDGAQVNTSLFQTLYMPTNNQINFVGNVRVAGIHKKGRYDNRKFYIMVPQMTWNPAEGIRYEQFDEIAKTYGGRVATEDEAALYLAFCVSKGEPWENICDKPDSSPWYRVCRNPHGDLVLMGGSTKAEEFQRHTNFANRELYVISTTGLPREWKTCCAVPLIVKELEEEFRTISNLSNC